MSIRRNRIISGFLSFVMVMTMVLGVIPPIEVSAGTPGAVTDEETNVTDSSVTLNGHLSKNGGYTIKEYGFAYGINNGSTKYKTFYGALEKEKNVSFVLKNLSPGDAGWYQFYVVNSNNEEHKGEYEYWEIEDEDSNPPVIDPIKSSAGTSFAYGKSTTFSTKVSDETELDEIIMYIDGDKVKSVSASGTSGSISYTTSKLALGEHEILVEAYDAAGNDNSTDITVEVLLERPEIISPDTHTWPSDEDLTIKWDAVSGASYYLVTVTDNDVNNNIEYIYDEKKVSDSLRKITVYSDDLYGEHYLKVSIVAYSSDGIESLIGAATFYIEPASIIIDPDIIGFSAAGGTYDIDVYSDSNWKIENLSSYSSWITASHSSGFGDKTITLTIKKNTTAYERDAALKFTDDYETVYLKVTQAGVEQYLNVSDETLIVDYRSGNSGRIDIESNIEWSLAENTDWFSLSCKTGEGDGSFYFIVDENPTSESRTGSAWIHSSVGIVEVKLTQEGTTTEPEEVPCVTSLTVSPTEGKLNDTYTFTAKAENTNKVVFYVGGHKIGEVTSTSGTFKCTYNKFTSGGDRIVYAYPCDEYGNEIRKSGSYQTKEFTITVDGTLSPVKISTDSYQNIDVNTSFTVKWTDTASVPNDVSYRIYVWYDGEQVGDVMNTSSHSKTIPASYFMKEGHYVIGIYAVSETWDASDGVYIAVNVTADKPFIENFAISPNTVSLGGAVKLSGMVYGNGSDIAQIIIKITNNSDGTGGVYKTLYPNGSKLNMSDTPGINTSDAIFTTPGTYSVKLYALNEGAVNEVLLGQKTLQVVADSRITLNTPVLGGTSTISYGDDYTVSWNYDEGVDYYLIGISGLTYSKTVDASNSSYTIPFSVFKQYLGSSGSNFTVYVTAMGDSDSCLPSAKESKTVYVSGDASEKAVIKSVTLPGRDHNEVTAGEIVTFKVVTSTDVEAIRMKDGAGTFIVNTWNSGYTDSGSNRTWTIKQKVSYAGGSDVDYVNRSLTFYSMIGNTEYNKCNVTFICVKDAVVGAFDITNPVNGSEQQPERSLTITWTEPDTGVDYYVVDIAHDGVRIDEDVFPYEVRNGNSYTLDGSYLIRDNNAWNIQVTGVKVGMADASDSVRFVLKCQHEKLGAAVEKYLSYTNTGSSSTHSVKTEKTYPCLECGMTNAKTETETKTVNHSFITLDEGGKVCNQCWYVNSNGSYDVQYDMSLVTTNSNGRENVYANVGTDGNPVNVQSGRYVETGDSITVWGVLGNSCLIEYPTSSGTHKGFISNGKISVLGETDTSIEGNYKTYNQLLAEDYIDMALSGKDWYSVYENEFLTSKMVATNEVKKSDSYTWSLLQNVTNSFGENLKYAFIQYFGNDADFEEWEKTLFYEFLYSCIVNIPNDIEVESDAFDSVDDLWSFLETKTGVEDLSELNTESLATLNVDKNSLEKVLSLGSDTPIIGEALNTTKDILKETGGQFADTAIQSGVNALIAYYRYLILQTATDIEIFDVLIDIYGSDSVMKAAILELKSQYQNAGLNVLKDVAKDIKKLGQDLVVENGLMTIPGGVFVLKVKAAINVIDFIRELFVDMTGLSTLADSSLNLVLMYDYLLFAKMHMRILVNKYEKSNRTNVDYANQIVLLYDFIRGCQIFINQCAINVSDSDSVKTILRNENKHLKSTSIMNWSLNPYYASASITKPNTNVLDSSKYGYYYKILLEGYNNIDNDGLLGEWDKLSQYEKYLISEEVYELFEFAESDVSELYFMNIGKLYKTYSSELLYKNPYDELCVLFVNGDGMGLLLRYYNDSPDSKSHKAFSVMSREEIDNLLNGGNNLPTQYFFVNRYYYTYGRYQTAYDLLTNDDKGYRSVLFEAMQNKNMEKVFTVAEKYFKLEIDSATYGAILEKTTSYKYYASVTQGIAEWDSIISDVFGVWIWTTPSIDYIAEQFNKHAQKTNNPKIAVNVIKTSWDFELN